MKTILVPTDLSGPANHATRYALHLAKVLKLNIKLCNAMRVPAESYMATQMAWPAEDYSALRSETDNELYHYAQALMKEAEGAAAPDSFHPMVSHISEVGDVTIVVRNRVKEDRIPLVVMGMSGAGTLSRFFLGSNSRSMINYADFPLLLIPADANYHPLKKIAYATDLNEQDVQIIQSLATIARDFNAEIIISHITDEPVDEGAHKQKIDDFLKEVTAKVNYPKIFYRHIKAFNIERGLDWICEHGQVQMLVMSHAQRGLFEQLWASSETQKLARHIRIPLLIYPQNIDSAALTVF